MRWLVALALMLPGCKKDRHPPPSEAARSPVAIPGRAAEPLVVYAAGSPLPPPEPTPGPGMRALAFDDTNLYLLDNRVGRLLAKPRDGRPVVAVSMWSGKSGKLVVAGGHAYVSVGDGVTEIALGDGKSRAVACGTDGIQDFAADTTHVYCATARYYGSGPDGPDGKIIAVAADGKQVELATKVPGPTTLSVDDTNVYYSAQGQIASVPKRGGPVTVIAKLGDDYGWMSRVVGRYVYFTAQSNNSVYLARVPIGGGDYEPVATMPTQPTSFAVAGDDLYLVVESDKRVGTLWRVDLSTHALTTIATGLEGYPFMTADARQVAWLSGEDAFLLDAKGTTPLRIHPD
ncbi:MAG TPA: hypothetical protein VGO00_27475 [Kofleriaceae bacterium]|jgi:hypothetical protein|nr:hypothetical protein [Kofleriaceae bacterium]